jgi:hypothetical protein
LTIVGGRQSIFNDIEEFVKLNSTLISNGEGMYLFDYIFNAFKKITDV